MQGKKEEDGKREKKEKKEKERKRKERQGGSKQIDSVPNRS